MALPELDVRAAAFAMGAAYAWMGLGFFRPAFERHRAEGAPVRSRGSVPALVDRLWVATQGWLVLGLAVAFFAPGMLAWSPVSMLGLATPATSALGVALQVSGCGLVAWASRHLGAELTVAIEAREGGRLVTSGPYARVRHPIYTGVFLIVAGEALALAAPLLAAYGIVSVVCATLRARAEETMLASDPVHGLQYRAYLERTRRFVPGLARPSNRGPG